MNKTLAVLMFLAAIGCAHAPESDFRGSFTNDLRNLEPQVTEAEPMDPESTKESLTKTVSAQVDDADLEEAIDLENIQFLSAVLRNGTTSDKQRVFCEGNPSHALAGPILPNLRSAVYKKAGNSTRKRQNIGEMLANYGSVVYCKGFKAKYPDLTRKLGNDFLKMVGNIPVFNGDKGSVGARGYYYLR